MDFRLSEPQAALVRHVRELATRKLKPMIAGDTEAQMARMRQAMAELNLLGLNLPKDYGGMELPLVDTLLVIQELQRIDAMLGGLAHRSSTGAVGAIQALGTPAQKENYVRGVCEGRIGISIAISEPEAGSAATAMRTSARIERGEVVLNGQKLFVSFARYTTHSLVYCRFGDTGRASDIGAVIVPHDAPGFTRSAGTLNMAGEYQYELYFDGCRLPRENVLVEGAAFARLINVYNSERLGSLARMLGSAQASFEEAVAYANTRRQFDRELGDFQGIQWLLADMKIKLEAAQLLTYRAACNAVDGLPERWETSVAKVYTAQVCKEICDDAIQIFGGYGFMQEYPLERRYREVRGGSIYGGTIQIHKNMIAAHVLGRPLSQWKRDRAEAGPGRSAPELGVKAATRS